MPADTVAEALSEAGIALRNYKIGQHRTACPKCKREKRDSALSVTIKSDDDAVWHCHRCDFAGGWRPGNAVVESPTLIVNGASYKYGKIPTMRAAADSRTQEQVAQTAREVWDAAANASPEHPYLLAKDVLAHGIKEQDGFLLVPMRDIAGDLHSIQRIDAAGGKLYPQDALSAGCFHLLGSPNRVVYVCEGYATAATIHEATGDAAVAAFCADNLAPVVAAWRLKLPDVQIVIAADNDHKTEGNPGLAKAQAAADVVGGIIVAAPDIADLPDGGTDWNDVAQKIGAHLVRERLTAVATERTANGLPMVTYAAAKPQIDAPYLVKGWLLAGELSALTGAPGCGKTFLALDVDAHIAAGLDWFGYRVRQTGVVYLAAEGGSAIFNRIAAIKQRFGYDDSLPLAIIPAGVDLVSGQAGPAALVAAVKRAEAAFGRPVGKVTVDTVSRVLCGADENSSEAMGGLIRAADAIRAATGAHLTLIHHLPKDGTRGKGGRGHSSLWGAIDTEIGVERDLVTRIATATVLKQRNAEEGASVSFDLDIVQLGTDADGDAVSSCIIRPAEAPKQSADVKMSASCSLALSALRLALSEGGQPVPASRYVPANTIGVPVDLWRKYAYERSISGGEQSAKRKAFQRASEQLQSRGVVGAWDGWVWIP
jgi:putative DNA primase/helicase